MGALSGKRVLLPRSEEQASETVALLEAHGAEVVAFPAIAFVPPTDPAPLRAAMAHLNDYTWITFTSANAVRWFLRELPEGARVTAKIASVGPKTSELLRERGLSPAVQANVHRADALAHALLGAVTEPARERILFPRAEEGRDDLRDALIEAGAEVDCVAAYRTELPGESDRAALLAELEKGIDAILFSSPSTVRNLVELVGGAHRVRAAACIGAIGPVTAAAAKQAGLAVHVTADPSTMEALVSALEAYFAAR